MKKNLKLFITIIIVILLFLGIFFVAKRMSLNNYLNKTIKTSDNINYSTSIQLSIDNLDNSSKIEYDITRTPNIKKIIINNYINEDITNSIIKYIVDEDGKNVVYRYNGSKYEKVKNDEEDFVVNYEKIKKNILKIKKVDNVVIDDISYKKYVVSMKAYDAYNLLYDKDIVSKDDLNKNVDVNIFIDKSKNFVYKISYTIDNINNSDNNNDSIKYKVEITNKNIGNKDSIKLPF